MTTAQLNLLGMSNYCGTKMMTASPRLWAKLVCSANSAAASTKHALSSRRAAAQLNQSLGDRDEQPWPLTCDSQPLPRQPWQLHPAREEGQTDPRSTSTTLWRTSSRLTRLAQPCHGSESTRPTLESGATCTGGGTRARVQQPPRRPHSCPATRSDSACWTTFNSHSQSKPYAPSSPESLLRSAHVSFCVTELH